MSMADETAFLKPELHQLFVELHTVLQQAVQDGTAVHEVERAVWHAVLRIGHQALQQFFTLLGSGDQGATVAGPDGRSLDRLPELHDRRYVSIFGEFTLHRTAYGSREGQKIEFVPLDNRLQLPASAFSYVLQDWDQALCAENAFGQVNVTIARMLGLKQSVDSLEHMNQDLAQSATPFRLHRPVPPAAEEGELFVVSADGKGVVLRRGADDPAPVAHRTKGDKASQKRMATVGTVYSVDRYVRTPAQIVAALFRDGPRPEAQRPRPQHKQVWASLPQADVPVSGLEAVFVWLLWELGRRNPGRAKEVVYLSDGQELLWEAQAQYLGGRCLVGILDLLHVTPRLWKVAHVFHAEKSPEAEAFVRERLLRILQGQVARVVQGLRVMGGRRPLTAAKRKTLRQVCNYLEKNQERMRYDEYLAAGYPQETGTYRVKFGLFSPARPRRRRRGIMAARKDLRSQRWGPTIAGCLALHEPPSLAIATMLSIAATAAQPSSMMGKQCQFIYRSCKPVPRSWRGALGKRRWQRFFP